MRSAMFFLKIAASLFAICGHTAIWTTFVNQAHATRLPKAGVVLVNIVGLGSLCGLPLVYAVLIATHGFARLSLLTNFQTNNLVATYYQVCMAVGVIALGWWTRHKLAKHDSGIVRCQTATRHDMVERLGTYPLGGGLSRFITRLPWNECFQLEVSEKELAIPTLDSNLDGLTIAHLSDLHFADAIDKRYFVEVAEITNALRPDLIVLTGDLVDRYRCIDWVPDTLGRLHAPHGIYAIFGNHDVRLKHHLNGLRDALVHTGIIYLGGRSLEKQIRSTRVIIAGNEMPWRTPAPDMSKDNVLEPKTLRLLLSHSPDQFRWARMHNFDLMLAGHNHGGQISIPFVGPLFSPSRYGVRYAGGTFYEAPTVLHVSRGISALDPIRYNCLPELALLTLRSPAPAK